MARALALWLSALMLMPCVAFAGDNDGFCKLRPIAGYEGYFINSVENGDATGRPFVVGRDDVLQRGVTVRRIATWTGNRFLTGLEVTLSDETVHMYGHKNGGSSSYTFANDEVLTYWYQWKSKKGAHKIAGIEFKTSKGSHYKHKASDTSYGCNIGCEKCLVRDIGSGVLAGFQGYECGVNGGGDICRLTPIIMRPIKYARLTNITYPQLDTAPPPITSVLYDYPVINNTTQISTTKFIHSVTTKQAYTYTTSTADKFSQSLSLKVGITGEVPGVKESVELTSTYTWETTKTVTDTTTTEKSVTDTQEFTFVCPASSACRFVVSQGDGRLTEGYNDYNATNVITMDSGAVFSYPVDGQVKLSQLTPVNQYAVSGPLSNTTATAATLAASAPTDHASNDSGDGEGIPQADAAFNRTVGAPALLAYRRCPHVDGRQLCTLEQRLPDTVVRALAGRLMMAPSAISGAQEQLPHRPGFVVVDYAAPIVMSRRGARGRSG